MAIEVKIQPTTLRDDVSDDASSVTAVSYEDTHGTVVKGCPNEAATPISTPSTSYRTAEDILRLTLEDSFFQPCSTCSLYRSGREVQLTFFNLDTRRPCCSVCKPSQGANAIVQVRRSSYHDVVRVSEIVGFFDIATIQPYWINNDRVVFLRPRPQPRPPRGCSFPAVCMACNRQLMDSQSSFCSLQCKLQNIKHLKPSQHTHPLAPLTQWGSSRKRFASAAESYDKDSHPVHSSHIHSPRSCSEDEEGLSSAKFLASRFGFAMPRVPLTGSKKRKLTPVRSPLW